MSMTCQETKEHALWELYYKAHFRTTCESFEYADARAYSTTNAQWVVHFFHFAKIDKFGKIFLLGVNSIKCPRGVVFYTRASEQGLMYTSDKCHHLLEACCNTKL